MSGFKVKRVKLGSSGTPVEKAVTAVEPIEIPADVQPEPKAVDNAAPASISSAVDVPDIEKSISKDCVEFIKHLYDGTPFQSTYMIVDNIYLTFRELTPKQIAICRMENAMPDKVCYMLASIAAYENKRTGEKYELVPIDQMEVEGGYNTPLPSLLAWISDKVLKTEGMFDLAMRLYGDFKHRLGILYNKARSPDFFVQNCPDAS